MRERKAGEASALRDEIEARCLREVYAYARRARALVRRLHFKHVEDENLSAAEDHARSLVVFLRETRRDWSGVETQNLPEDKDEEALDRRPTKVHFQRTEALRWWGTRE